MGQSVCSVLSVVGQIALVLTLFAVVWYTTETHLLRRLQIRPALLLSVDISSNQLCLQNVGSSAALNVQISDFKGYSKGTRRPIPVHPNWFPVLSVNDQRTLETLPQDRVGLAFVAIFADAPLQLLLSYEDIDGRSYRTLAEVDTKRTRIVYTRRVYPCWDRLKIKFGRTPAFNARMQ